jgi:hypothetical protein
MRMMWWFVILGLSGAVAVSAAVAIYARVRRHMKTSAAHEESEDIEIPPEV